MKFIFLLIPFLLLSFKSLSQDIIVFQNGEEIEVLVREVGTKEVKYVKFDNQTGPLYAESKSNIFMIKYQNGTKDVFTTEQQTTVPISPSKKEELKTEKKAALGVKQGFWNLKYFQEGQRINKYEFVNALRTDPEAYAYYSKYGTTKIIDRFFGGLSMLGAIFAVSFSVNMQNQPALISAVGGLLAGVVSRVYDSRAKSNLELAVLTYNKNLE